MEAPKSQVPKIIIGIIGLVVLALFAIYVWPTRYSYDHMRMGQRELVVRIDRFSGVTEILYPDGWRVAAPTPKPSPVPSPLSSP